MFDLSPETWAVFSRVADIERLVKEHPEDGPITEDEYVRVYREGGIVKMQGKPIRIPFRYK
jgi:hypothetical protein